MNKSEIQKLLGDHLKENLSSYKENMIKRYVDFVHNCHFRNKAKSSGLEKHHILPKSIYPEYKNFRRFRFNLAKLSYREHILAHIMLHHIFGGNMSYALMRMIGTNYMGFANRHYDKIRSAYFGSEDQIMNSKKGVNALKEKLDSGMRIYYDENGDSYGLMYDYDPRIKLHNLRKDVPTDKMIEQRKKWGKITSQGNIGKLRYHNGIIARKFKPGEEIPDGFVRGLLVRNPKKPGIKQKNIKIPFRDEGFKDHLINLLIQYEGDTEQISKLYYVSRGTVANACKELKIDYRDYWDKHKRYLLDKDYKVKVDSMFNGNKSDILQYISPKKYEETINLMKDIVNSGIIIGKFGWASEVERKFGIHRKEAKAIFDQHYELLNHYPIWIKFICKDIQ